MDQPFPKLLRSSLDPRTLGGIKPWSVKSNGVIQLKERKAVQPYGQVRYRTLKNQNPCLKGSVSTCFNWGGCAPPDTPLKSAAVAASASQIGTLKRSRLLSQPPGTRLLTSHSFVRPLFGPQVGSSGRGHDRVHISGGSGGGAPSHGVWGAQPPRIQGVQGRSPPGFRGSGGEAPGMRGVHWGGSHPA